MNSQIVQTSGGCTPFRETCKMVNRTGAALVKGDLVSMNLDFAATSGQAMAGLDPSLIDTDGSTGYVFGAAITCTAENTLRFVAVADEAIADNAYGRFVLRGICTIKMSTTLGYILTTCTLATGAINGTPTQAIGAANQAALDAAVLAQPIIGICLETTTTTGQALFLGGFLPNMYGGGA